MTIEGHHDSAGGRPYWDTWIVFVVLLVFLISQYGYGLTAPFINDDYIFLDKARGASLVELWAPRDLLFHYYRPWSREMHFAVLQRLFGVREMPFHLASFGLWLAVMTGWFVLARRLGGGGIAAISTAGVAALSGWAVPVLWASGAQELWMLLWAVLSLLAFVNGRTAWSVVLLALALLSKETAALLPGIATLYVLTQESQSWRAALRRTASVWAITAVWALLHPLVGGRWWSPPHEPSPPGLHPPVWVLAGHTLRSMVNLTPWPHPESGWARALVGGLPALLSLGALVVWGTLRDQNTRKVSAGQLRPARPLVSLGLGWAILGWLPLALPTIAWRSHYGLLGALGFWLAASACLVRWPRAALVAITGLALLRPAVGDTPSDDWSSEWYRRRAASFIGFMRADLMSRVPDPPSHTRFYFVMVPSHVGFLAGDGPALRVWYRDPTLSGGFYPSYRARLADEPQGPDLFFRYDSTAGWVQIRPGREDVAEAQAANPRWAPDHQVLAQTFARADNWGGALAEYLKLAGADSLNVEVAFNIGVCYEALGDSLNAARWHLRAAALPGADDEMRAVARQYEEHIRRSRDLRGGSSRLNP